MYTIKTLNAISPVGLAKLPKNQFDVTVDAEGVDKLVDFMEKFRKENA